MNKKIDCYEESLQKAGKFHTLETMVKVIMTWLIFPLLSLKSWLEGENVKDRIPIWPTKAALFGNNWEIRTPCIISAKQLNGVVLVLFYFGVQFAPNE